MPSINFVCSKSKNYKEVQRNIFDLVSAHLTGCKTSKTFGEKSPSSLNFTLFIRQPADVLMSHGVADKRYLFMMNEEKYRYVNNFSHIFVPGNWIKDQILKTKDIKLSCNNIHVVGWPRLEYLRQLQNDFNKSVGGQRTNYSPTILWAPTHDFRKRGSDQKSTSSYPGFVPYISKLEKSFNVLTSLHPRNRGNKTPTSQKLIESDIVISDFGTLVYEAWALGKPVIFPRWILQDSIIKYLPRSAEAHIFSNNIGFHPQSFDELVDIVNSHPTVDEHVSSFLEYYLPNNVRWNGAQNVASKLLELC